MKTDGTIPSASVCLDAELVDAYRTAIGHRSISGGSDPGVPPSMAGVILYAALRDLPQTAGVVLVGQSYRLRRPLRVGDVLTTSGDSRIDRDQRGRRRMWVRCTTVDAAGEVVMTSEIERLLPKGSASDA